MTCWLVVCPSFVLCHSSFVIYLFSAEMSKCGRARNIIFSIFPLVYRCIWSILLFFLSLILSLPRHYWFLEDLSSRWRNCENSLLSFKLFPMDFNVSPSITVSETCQQLLGWLLYILCSNQKSSQGSLIVSCSFQSLDSLIASVRNCLVCFARSFISFFPVENEAVPHALARKACRKVSKELPTHSQVIVYSDYQLIELQSVAVRSTPFKSYLSLFHHSVPLLTVTA